jgi:hypothetical protein
VRTLQTQLKNREREIASLKEQMAESSDLRYGKDKVIAIVISLAFILLLYAVYLQVSLTKAKALSRKK